MPVTLNWREIALRLILTVVAGAVIGLNRGEHGHPAGLRTTILVCLAASLSMIATNLLLDTHGKPNDSFVVMDLMRLPLGILSGIGFIGAGAIVRRGDMVEGVTTAATLWFVTMLGICIGGGMLVLGMVSLAIGFAVLSVLKAAEAWLPVERRATLELTLAGDGEIKAALFAELSMRGCRVVEQGASARRDDQTREVRYEIRWRGRADDAGPAKFFQGLAATPGVVALRWRIGAH
ncbi:MAG TPA: MgtC/SapB family protein [Stellaceae bacterium]|jgi:putative Mg2+ transporter-C (MgtC) family protein|nr:MgtC/SapB family protein [Stellaceae bacterium]